MACMFFVGLPFKLYSNARALSIQKVNEDGKNIKLIIKLWRIPLICNEFSQYVNQLCRSHLTCSHPELTQDHVLEIAYVMIFWLVATNIPVRVRGIFSIFNAKGTPVDSCRMCVISQTVCDFTHNEYFFTQCLFYTQCVILHTVCNFRQYVILNTVSNSTANV